MSSAQQSARKPDHLSDRISRSPIIISHEQLDTIASVYDVALDPSNWRQVLDRVVGQCNARGAALFVTDPVVKEFQLNAVSSIYTPEILRAYFAQFGELESESRKAYAHLLKFPARQLFLEREILKSVYDIDQSPAVHWFRNELNIGHRVAGRLHDRGAWLDVMTLQYGTEYETLDEQDFEIGTIFLPHLAKAVELTRTFSVLKSRFGAVLAVLDRFHTGVLILSPNGTVVLRNNEADRILDLKDGISLDMSRRPRLHLHDEQATLNQAVSRVISTAHADDDCAESVLRVTRRSGTSVFLVEVCPLRDPKTEFEEEFRGAMMLIIDPSHTQVISTQGMAELYHLTPAESEVCRLLAEGYGTREIAEMRNASLETVRNQVKSILHKSGVPDRSQLMRLALTVNLPIDPQPAPQQKAVAT